MRRALTLVALVFALAPAPAGAAETPTLRLWQAERILVWTAPVSPPSFRVERCERRSRTRIACYCSEPPYLDIEDEGLRDVYWSAVERRGGQWWLRDGGSMSPRAWRRLL